MQCLSNRLGIFISHDSALIWRELAGLQVDLVQQLAVLQCLLGQHALIGRVQIGLLRGAALGRQQ